MSAGGRLRPTLVLGGALMLLAGCGGDPPSALDPHGSEARQIADVWWLLFALGVAVYVGVAALIVAATGRGRHAAPEPTPGAQQRFLWLGGLALPGIILTVVAVVTVVTTQGLRVPEAGALRIEVVGERWWWDVRYPDAGVRTANEIHVPVGRQVEIGLRSDNVVHSFWVPQLAGKVDTIPGQRNVLRFTAETAGTYRGACAEFCGLQHAHMDFIVVAEEGDDFDRWLDARVVPPPAPTDPLATEGERVFQQEACAGCHTVEGTEARGNVGPDLSDFGSRDWIGAVTVPNTRGYLSGWISNSQTIKPGNLMPPITLEPDELEALVAYLEGLDP